MTAASSALPHAARDDLLEGFAHKLRALEAQREAVNVEKAKLYRAARENGISTDALKSFANSEGPASCMHMPARYHKIGGGQGRLPKSAYQAPRLVTFSEQRRAYKAGAPVSQDFQFWDASVYVAATRSAVKIGISNEVEQRISKLRSDGEKDLSLIGQIPGCRQTELSLLEAMSPWRRQGEWFDLTPASCIALAAALMAMSEGASLAVKVAGLLPTLGHEA